MLRDDVPSSLLDYGSGNIRSAERAVARAGADVTVTADARLAAAADGLVVPGRRCLRGLHGGPGRGRRAGDDRRRLAAGRPTLAICVGPPGAVRGRHRARRTRRRLRRLAGAGGGAARRTAAAHGLEHRQAAAGSRVVCRVEAERFYFVHSYGVRDLPAAPERRITWAEHGGDRFVAAVEEGTLWSTQFHPEKSGDAGARLIRNWVATL